MGVKLPIPIDEKSPRCEHSLPDQKTVNPHKKRSLKLQKIIKNSPKYGGLTFTRGQNCFVSPYWVMGVFWDLPSIVTHKC